MGKYDVNQNVFPCKIWEYKIVLTVYCLGSCLNVFQRESGIIYFEMS